MASEEKPNVSLVLGIEIDELFASSKLMHDWHWIRTYGFLQYTMYAPRRFSPLLRKAITRTLAQTKQHYQRSNILTRNKYDEGTTLETTGPGVFTDAILDGLSEALPETHPLVTISMEKDKGVGGLSSGSGEVQRRVTWAPFHRLKEPLFTDTTSHASDMGGLTIMPISVWGNGQRHSDAGSIRDVQACVKHHFKGTGSRGR